MQGGSGKTWSGARSVREWPRTPPSPVDDGPLPKRLRPPRVPPPLKPASKALSQALTIKQLQAADERTKKLEQRFDNWFVSNYDYKSGPGFQKTVEENVDVEYAKRDKRV